MERFLTNFNPQKRPAEANSVEQREKRKNYKAEKWKREFLQSWKASYRWLENTDQGMVCKICTKFDKTRTFVTGCILMNMILMKMMIYPMKNLTFREQINHMHLMISVNSWNDSFR
jgi:hypothetical protein